MNPLRLSRRLPLLGASLFLAASTAAPGAIIIQELFDSIAGTGGDSSLNGKGDTATSIGMTGVWQTNGGTGIYTANNFNTGNGLPGLPSNGGSPGGIWNNSGSYSTGIYATRSLSTTLNFAANQVIYFSVLLNNSGDTSMGVGLANGANGSASFVGAGLTWNNARALSTGALDSGNAAYTAYGTLDADSGVYGIRSHEAMGSINGAALLVGRLTLSATGSDSIDIIRYTTGDLIPSDPAAISWVASSSFDSSMVADHLVLWTNGTNGAGAGEVDGIRFGTTWGDVTGVPEPAAALLGLCGLVPLIRRRRAN